MTKQKWKLVAVDNYNREDKADLLICENITTEKLAKVMCEAVNKYWGVDPDRWCAVKSQDYVLSKGLEDLI